ncbi:hypothetical protein ALC57_04810 [Trachymyrmex cornetzi]|uniref:Uncharacterized protein n=1 Tax=Trachymyrmex cornetzi TaxID=471704 RepID=A0A195ED39_9HYME|nr:hypothetical protein ALC57_04810 [Trachymyrmex cornetzi]
MNRRTNPPDYPPERMVLLSNVNHTHRRRFAPPAMFSNQGDNFSIGKRANAELYEGLEYAGKIRYVAKERKKRLLKCFYFFLLTGTPVLAGKLWVNNMTSVESKVEQVLANGKEEERKGARGCRQEGNPGGGSCAGAACGSECVGYITGRMPSSLSLALFVVAATRSSSTPMSLPGSVTFRCAVHTDLHLVPIGKVSDIRL